MLDSGNLTCTKSAIANAKFRISKSEIRNNIKIQMFKIQNKYVIVLSLSVFSLRFLSFEFVSCFDIRISDLITNFYKLQHSAV